MTVNFREALATLSRALSLVLFRAGIFIAGGFMVIIIFAMLLFIFRLGNGASPVVAVVFTLPAVVGGWILSRVLQRFFLFRNRAALLLFFSGCSLPAPGLAAASKEAGRFFPDYSGWLIVNRGLRRTLSAFYRGSKEFPVQPAVPLSKGFSRILDRLAVKPLSQAVLVLAFSRNGTDAQRAVREGLALYLGYGSKSRHLAQQWLWFSASGLAFLFLCLALPNWFIFRSAGAPVSIGLILAAAIAWLLHLAFVVPFVLAGLSSGLLAETRGKTPDPDLCEKLSPLFPDTSSAR